MITPQQPDDDPKVEPELIKDLDVPDDDADYIAGGSAKSCSLTRPRVEYE